jgi:3-hydroxyacyl-CoA dehydrogenase/enoyl-CoA hydratase/3-hydroxybutyryl-CoA epimerase
MATDASLSTDLITLDVDTDGVATLRIDQPDKRVNTISEATLTAFEEAIDVMERDTNIRAGVFISGKDASFIVGADLDMIKTFETPGDARALSQRAHALIRRVQALGKPTVAAINGPAMGGGLEMALGCTYRIATTHDATKLALPEVQLGLLPGGGGTQHLSRLVGIQQALTMMLTGKNIYPKKAQRIGLVDALIHPPGLHHAATEAARQLADGTLTPQRAEPSFTDRLLESNTVSRRVIYQQAGERTKKRTHGNYPAPPKIIECVKVGMEDGLDAGLDLEARYFGELVFTAESKALVSLFFAKQDAEKNPMKEHARPVREIGVLGAGLMGAGIAQISAEKGMDVVLKDQNLELAAKGRKHVWDGVHKKARKGILSAFEEDVIVERVAPVSDYAPLKAVDVVIEAVPEDLDLKRQVLADTEAVIRDDAVFASNTSSIPIAEIADGAEHPERVLGMHYFSPVPQIPLLELIVTDETSEAALATAFDAGLAQGKTVIVVNDGPGFYTTRILALYMNEALLLLEEGGDIEAIDAAMEQWGFPMGPFELFDLVGIDVAAKITQIMGNRLGDGNYRISDRAAVLAEANLLGQKTNLGFYVYEENNGDTQQDELNKDAYRFFDGPDRTAMDPETIQQRLGLMMVNAAVRCLEDGVLRSATDGDLGAVFGLGFPPFRGGPFRYVDQEGAAGIVMALEQLADALGPRYAPSALLHEHAAAGTPFHR